MRIKGWASLAVAAGTLTGVTALPATTVNAATTPQTLTVQVGGDSEIHHVAFEGMRFLAPQTVSVHSGDTLTFNIAGFHTATLLPPGESPQEWQPAHQGLTGDYSLLVPDSDDTTGSPKLEFNPAVVFPSDPNCGSATSPCDYDGKGTVNSGVLAAFTGAPWSVTISDKQNEDFWIVCLIHPDMAMHVQIVADTAPTTTQAEIDSYKTSTLAADHEAAAAALPKLQTPTRHTTAGGKTVWDAYAGYDSNGWGLDGMFPTVLHIKKGQTVRWHFAQLMGNPHTVTFPKKQAVALNGQFPAIVCEGASGDTPPTVQGPPFCADPSTLEFEVSPAAVTPAGDHAYAGTSSGLHSSGIEGAGVPSQAPYDLKFTHKSHKKGFRYACTVHGGMMSGTVIVS